MSKTTGFADNTSVPAEKTRAEIEGIIRRYKADAFQSGWDASSAWVMFRAHDRFVKFKIILPDQREKRFTHDLKRNWIANSESKRAAVWEQSTRTIWRRLLLCIKAKLESVASGIETFESAFLSQIILPNGQTAGEWAGPQIDHAYATNDMPKMLGGYSPKEEPRVLPHPNLKTGTDGK